MQYLHTIKGNEDGGKLRTYSLLKNNYEIEPYLKSNMPRQYRCKIAALRVGSHDLEIERGRYSIPKIPANSRYCKFCRTQVEDECHFLIKCSLYMKQRLQLLTKLKLEEFAKNNDDASVFIHLLTAELCNEMSCHEIGKHIYECLKLRCNATMPK